MKDALEFALRVFLKHGIWIAGAAWFLALGSRWVFTRACGVENRTKTRGKA